MTDKELFALIVSSLGGAMSADVRLRGVALARNFQPRQQGRATGPTVYFFKLADKRFGHPQRADVWNSTTSSFDHTEAQLYESPFQFSAWIPQDSSDVTALTESDILNIVSGIIQSDAILAAFRAKGVGILRVTDVRNPFIVDDRDRFEAVPTFDVVLTHYRNIVATLPAVVTYDANVSRV